jgi:hypothetical protein
VVLDLGHQLATSWYPGVSAIVSRMSASASGLLLSLISITEK